MDMDTAEIIAYSFFVTAGVTTLYLILLAIETKRGIRLGRKFRQYMDQKVTTVAKRLGKNATLVNTLYERGVDEVEKDLIDPVAKPIIETQHQYTKLKTGEREIVYTGKRGVSPHLQKIVDLHKKSKKKKRRRKKKRKGEKQLQPQKQPAQPEQSPEGEESKRHDEQ